MPEMSDAEAVRALPKQARVTPDANPPAAAPNSVAALLARFPDAYVNAGSVPDGWFVALPEDAAGRATLAGRSALDYVRGADRLAIITAWKQLLDSGESRVDVQLATEPPIPATFSFHRLPDQPLALVFCETNGYEIHLAEVADAPPNRPKLCRWILDQVGTILKVDASTPLLLGWTAADLIGKSSLETIHPDDQALAVDTWMDQLAHPGRLAAYRYRRKTKDGRWLWFEVNQWLYLEHPDGPHAQVDMVDITEAVELEEAARAQEQLLQRLTEALPLGVVQFDPQRRIVYANDGLLSFVGNRSVERFEDLLSHVLVEDRALANRAMEDVLLRGQDRDLELRLRGRGRRPTRHCTVNIRALSDSAGRITGAVAAVVDVTDSVKLRQELEDRATFDPLTRCFTRRAVMDRLERALADRDRTGVAVVYLDLDSFKQINDTLGHSAGDELLRIAAQRIQRRLRASQIVGRLGGDEFLVVATDIRTPQEALRLGQRLSSALQGEVRLGTQTTRLRSSVGVAHTREHLNADALIQQADEAMYQSKRAGAGHAVLGHHTEKPHPPR